MYNVANEFDRVNIDSAEDPYWVMSVIIRLIVMLGLKLMDHYKQTRLLKTTL